MRKTLHSPSEQPREIAVLAERGLVDALRLAGVGRFRALPADKKMRDEVNETLREWLGNEAIGVIVIGEEHAALVGEQIGAVRASKRITPVIVSVPSLGDAADEDFAGRYQALARRFLGMDIVLQEGGGGGDGDDGDGRDDGQAGDGEEDDDSATGMK